MATAKFVKLTRSDCKRSIFINVDKIVAMEIVDNETLVYTKKRDNNVISVKETPEQILELYNFIGVKEFLKG